MVTGLASLPAGRLRASLLVVAALGCARPPPPAAPPRDPDAEARAVAQSFLHCVERAGAECRSEAAPYEAFAAVQLLARLRDAVPTLLLARLDEWLESVRHAAPARRALVQSLTALEAALRQGDCAPATVRRLLPAGAAPLAEAAVARAQRLGLLEGISGGDIAALPASAEPMGDGRVVEVACAARRFYLVLAPRDGSFLVVAAASTAPQLEPDARPFAPLSLPVPEGVLSPFLPVPEEAL